MKEIIYKTVGERAIELLFYPPTEQTYTKAPLFLLIPGGGWNSSVAASMYGMERSAAEALRAAGFAVAAISYRNHREDGVNMPAIVADVFDSAAYLAAHGEELGIDPTRFYTSGHSAGGHLALLLAYAPRNLYGEERTPFTVRATAPLSPPTWLPKEVYQPYLQFSIDGLFEGCTEEDYRLCSPETWVESAVPTLTAVGDKDDLVFPANGQRLHDKLLAAGVRSEFVVAQNGGHAFEPIGADTATPHFEDIQRQIVEFILDENAR